MRKLSVLVLVSILLIVGVVGGQASAQTPAAACPANGPLTLNQDLFLRGLSCTHVGSISVESGAVLSLLNSTLRIDANKSSAYLTVGAASSVVLTDSSLTFTNGNGTLIIGPNAEVHFVKSLLSGGEVNVQSFGSFSANESSVLNPNSFTSRGESSVFLKGSTLAIQGVSFLSQATNPSSFGVVSIEGRFFEAISSVVALNNIRNSSIAALGTYLLNSQVQAFGLGQIAIGNSTLAGAYTLLSSSKISTDSYLPTRTILAANSTLNVADSTVESPESGTLILHSNQILVESSNINEPLAIMTLVGYQFNATNSNFQIGNSRPLIVFGSTVVRGNMFNDTFSSCTLPPKASCFGAIRSGGYSLYGLLAAQVTNGTSNARLAGAHVQVFDTLTGALDYTGITDSLGNATIPVLITQAVAGQKGTTSQTVQNHPSYVVQASFAGRFSPQAFLGTNNTMPASLSIAGGGAISPQALGSGAGAVSQTYGLASNRFPVSPTAFYVLGPYIGSEYIPTVTIASNAYPLNFFVNAGQTQLTFNTVGQTGLNASFVVYYPRNLTVSPIGVQVDGAAVSPVQGSNSTYYYSFFSFPSGVHSVVLTFIPPNGAYTGLPAYPYVYPTSTTIAAVLLISALGLFFVFLLVRSREGKALD